MYFKVEMISLGQQSVIKVELDDSANEKYKETAIKFANAMAEAATQFMNVKPEIQIKSNQEK